MHLNDSDRKRLADDIGLALSRAKDGSCTIPFTASAHIDPVDVPAWLTAQPRKTIWYWRSRDGQIEVGGIGDGLSLPGGSAVSSLDLMRKIQEKHPDFRPPMFCARRFSQDARYDDLQRHFQGDICRVPERMVARENNHHSFHLSFSVLPDSDKNSILDAVESGIAETRHTGTSGTAFSIPPVKATCAFPNRDGWRKNIAQALAAVDREDIKKIVLARRLDYHFEEHVDPVSLLMLLRECNRSCYSILHQPRPGVAFISVTPERLYLREADRITVDAISSTLPRGSTPEEDAILERKLLSDDKLRREHRFVSDTVMTDLTSLCDGDLILDGPRPLKLDRIQHIASIITGRLKSDVNDAGIVAALHPTPAVAGVPRRRAIAMIAETEPFARGWYAGAIGMIDGDRAEFAVGIRSAVVHDNSISVFTGAGIVHGSDPDLEWEEIESKDILRPLLSEKALS
jgi:menaquinone-specific isochorismate synthase